jgi:hypothetical protein
VNETVTGHVTRIVAGLICVGLLAFPAAGAARANPDTGSAPVRHALGLNITAPASANLGSTTSGGTVTAQLGSVTVDSTLGGAWTATVSTTTFATGGHTVAETIAKSRVSYWSGPITARSGIGTYTPGQATAGQAQTLDVPRTAFRASGLLTVLSSVTWNPTLVVAVPAAAVAGTYTGTVTHSVA